MTGGRDGTISPAEGAVALGEILEEAASEAAMDFLTLENIMDQVEEIVGSTGVEVPEFSEKFAFLRDVASEESRRFAESDAALWVGDLERSKALMRGAGLDIPDEPADDPDVPDLYKDIADGVPGAVLAFAETGRDPNIPSGAGERSALLAALDAPGRNAEDVALLIALGAEPGDLHGQGDDALSWAMGYHHHDTVTPDSEAEVIALLARNGGNPNHEIEGTWVTLHRAIVQAGAPQVAALLNAGADMTTPVFADFHPEKLANATPVMLAVAKPEVLRVLLNHGADPRSADVLGRTPLDFAVEEARAARARVDEADPWTIRHAEALETSQRMLEVYLYN